MKRRLAVGAGVVAAGAVLAWLAGWPQPGACIELLTGRTVTPAVETAFLTTLCWLALALTAGLVLGGARRGSRPRRGRSRALALAALVIGATMLAAGVVKQTGYRVCCATPATAQQAVQLVR